MPMQASVHVNMEGLLRMRKDFENDVFEVLRKRAKDVAAKARELVPVDTGALRASIYISHSRGSNYNFALAAARGLRDFEEAPNEKEIPEGKLHVIIGAAAPYAGYVEYGHFTRSGTFVRARPFMRPAGAGAEQLIIKDIQELIERYDINAS